MSKKGNQADDPTLNDNTDQVRQEPPAPAPEAVKAKADADALPEGIIARQTLRKPIKDQDDKVHTVIELREPTGGEYANFGQPYKMDFETGGFKPLAKVCIEYIESATGIHGPLLLQADPRDLDRLAWAVAGFLATD